MLIAGIDPNHRLFDIDKQVKKGGMKMIVKRNRINANDSRWENK